MLTTCSPLTNYIKYEYIQDSIAKTYLSPISYLIATPNTLSKTNCPFYFYSSKHPTLQGQLRVLVHSPFLNPSPPPSPNTGCKNFNIPKFHKLIQLRNKLFVQYRSSPNMFRLLQRTPIEYLCTLCHDPPRVKD